jgi:4-amino-4-deoxychorismate lyase
MTNVFIVSRGALLTPDLKHSGVEGVMRGLVLERASALSIDCRAAGLKREHILDADEVFLTNSLIGAWPVRRIDSREYPVGGITQRIQEAVRNATVGD